MTIASPKQIRSAIEAKIAAKQPLTTPEKTLLGDYLRGDAYQLEMLQRIADDARRSSRRKVIALRGAKYTIPSQVVVDGFTATAVVTAEGATRIQYRANSQPGQKAPVAFEDRGDRIALIACEETDQVSVHYVSPADQKAATLGALGVALCRFGRVDVHGDAQLCDDVAAVAASVKALDRVGPADLASRAAKIHDGAQRMSRMATKAMAGIEMRSSKAPRPSLSQ